MAGADITTADMVTTAPIAPFLFMYLPGELRNKVYVLLLCSFGQATDAIEVSPEDFFVKERLVRKLIRVSRTNNPAILRVSSQVHGEAYDVMVKTNKHVLDIMISSTEPRLDKATSDCGPVSVVILGRDLGHSCRSFGQAEITCPELVGSATIVINVAPMLARGRPWYQDDLTAFFSEATQNAILNPLRTIKGIKIVHVRGHVLPAIAATLKNDMTSENWKDPRMVFELLEAEKGSGANHCKEGRWEEAYTTWSAAMSAIIRIQRGTSWATLVKLGGEIWIDKVAKLQCSLGLNVTLAGIMLWVPHSRSASVPLATRQQRKEVTEMGLRVVDLCLSPGYWKEGYIWRCPDVLAAKVFYRRAVYIRLWGEIGEVAEALQDIEAALWYMPNDAAILAERAAIVKWASGM